MKRSSAINTLALLVVGSLIVIMGCGGGGTGGASLSEPEAVVDNALRAAFEGNTEPFRELIPPEWREFYGESLEETLQPENGKIVEIFYRTEQTDETHYVVYYWGTFEYEENGETAPDVMTEDQAQALPLVKEGDNWYLDLGPVPEEIPAGP